jgi:hypothetical protein
VVHQPQVGQVDHNIAPKSDFDGPPDAGWVWDWLPSPRDREHTPFCIPLFLER